MVILAVVAVWPARTGAADVEAVVAAATHGLRPVTRLLASDRLRGRDNDTPESETAQVALIRRLRRLGRGLDPAGRRLEAFKQRFAIGSIAGTNLAAVIRGRERPDEYVIVGAHYDHLDTRSAASGACSSRGTPGGAVCNGATDNAAGVAAVLAVGRAVKKSPRPPRRSVVLALWDAEEDGLVGSAQYVNAPLVPLGQTVAYVNVDILGADLLPALARTSFAVGAETGGTTLQSIVADAVATESFGTLPVSYIFGQLRSDYVNFVAKGVPTVYFSDSTNGCYHTTGDDLEIVDWAKLETQSRIAFRVVATLAEMETPPAFVSPNPALATFADAQSLQQVFTRAAPDLALFSPAEQQVVSAIRDAIDGIVAEGPGAFDAGDVATLLAAALDGIAAIQRLGCRPIRP